MNTPLNPLVSSSAAPAMRRERGLSLVELMVAIALGLFLLAGLVALLVNNSRQRQELEKATRQIDNGRYAIQLIAEDIRDAGFFGETDAIPPPVTPAPAVCPLAPSRSAALAAAVAYPIYSFAGATTFPTGTAWADCPAVANFGNGTTPTDILVVRRASTQTPVAVTSITGASFVSTWYVQTVPGSEPFVFPGGSAATIQFTLTHDDGTTAPVRPYLVHVYFIARDPTTSVPILQRIELGTGGFSVKPLVEGIENMRFEYGIDNNGDGAPDLFKSGPSDTEVQKVVSVRVHVLARGNEPSAGYADTKSFTLGKNDDGTDFVVPAANDRFRRHVFSAEVRLNNASMRGKFCPNANLCL